MAPKNKKSRVAPRSLLHSGLAEPSIALSLVYDQNVESLSPAVHYAHTQFEVGSKELLVAELVDSKELLKVGSKDLLGVVSKELLEVDRRGLETTGSVD